MSSLISSLIDNTLRITLDPYFMYPLQFKDAKRHIPLSDSSNTLTKYELIFDENLEKDELLELKQQMEKLDTDDEATSEEFEEEEVIDFYDSPSKDDQKDTT
jgi:hypothetical protein